MVEINRGPVITQFGVEPDFIENNRGRTRVRVGKIASLADDLAPSVALGLRARVSRGLARRLRVDYAVQDTALPEGFQPPTGRAKPWGTGHALVAATPFLEGPFAVLNADDFYGAGTYRILAEWLGRPSPRQEQALKLLREIAEPLRKEQQKQQEEQEQEQEQQEDQEQSQDGEGEEDFPAQVGNPKHVGHQAEHRCPL